MQILIYYARDHHWVSLPGSSTYAGRDLDGRPTRDGARVAYYPRRSLDDPNPPATRALIAACRAGEMWAGDEATARATGVDYVPLVCTTRTERVKSSIQKMVRGEDGAHHAEDHYDEVEVVDAWVPAEG